MTSKVFRKRITPILAVLLSLPSSYAQNPFGTRGSGSGSGGIGGLGSGSGTGTSSSGGLSKAQQQKFARSGTEDITNENFPETIESFDFPNADVADIVKAISELTGRNFMLDPGVRGKVTIIAPSKITVAEAYKMFLSALAIHGYAIVPSDGYYKIRPSRAAQRDSIETYSGSYYPNTDQMITKIIHLKYISADEVLKQFRNITTKDGDINAYAPTNSIIISDYGSNVDRIVKIINQLDVPGFEDQIEVVPVRTAKAKDLADLIEKIVNKGQNSNSRGGSGGISSGFQGAVPRFTRSGGGGSTSGQQGGSYFMAFPDERTNALIVVGNKAGIARVRKLVAQLDIRMNPADSGGVYVYYVKFGDAEKIAQVINGVAKDAGGDQAARRQGGAGGSPFLPPSFLNSGPDAQGAGGSGQIFGGDVKVTADKNSNSLVIVASRQDYEKVMNLLNRIDIAQDQVFVEAIIMEMTLSDADSWKVGVQQFGKYGKGGFSTFTADELAGLTSLTGGSGVILPFADGEVDFTQLGGQNGTTPGQSIKVPKILGFINFLKRQGKANVLSTPRILALNNQEAQIRVVDKVPTSINTAATSAGQTSNTTFEDAGIDLKIKPFISPASETIRMEITQLVSQPTQPTGVPAKLSESNTVIAKREVKTNIVIRNGDTAVLGGLVRDFERQSVNKVPVLGDIPVLGWLFKSNVTEKDKINLMVFLTPKVVRNSADQKSVLTKTLDERLDFIKDQGGKDPYGKKVDEMRKYKADAEGNIAPAQTDMNSNISNPTGNSSAPQSPAEMEDSTLE